MINGLFDSGAMPVIERTVQFTSARHRLMLNNIANLSTPNFKPTDLEVSEFQAALTSAVDRRRSRSGGTPTGKLEMQNTKNLQFGHDSLRSKAKPSNDGVLFHDGNNRDVERIMQGLAENAIAHNSSMELMKNQFSMLKKAIRGRI